MRRSALAIAVAIGVLGLPGAAAADWWTWGNGMLHNGRASGAALRASNASKLVHVWSRNLGGAVDAQPLYLTSAVVAGRRQPVYIAATEAGGVFALRAADGAVLWQAQVTPTQTTCQQLPGGLFGVTGSPVYDPGAHAVYVASSNQVWALDIGSGAVLPGWPVTLPFDPALEHVWGALARRGSFVYATTASYCDRIPYKGRVIRIDAGTRELREWDAVPIPGNDGGGGMWGWGGAAIDPATGDVWVATGNSIGPDVHGEADFDAEAVVQLDQDLNRLAASKAPGVPGTGDYDFGATPLLFRPRGCPPLAAALNKNGSLYLWRRAALARGPYQRVQLAYPTTLFGVPAWDPLTQTVFVTTTLGYGRVRGGLQALRVTRGCRLSLAWTRPLGGQLASTPTVSNDVVVVSTGHRQLLVFDTRHGRLLASRRLANAAYVAPVVAARDVAVTGLTRSLDVYRLPRR